MLKGISVYDMPCLDSSDSLPPAGQLQTEATAAHPVKGPSLVQEHFKYWTACAEEC